MQFEQIQSLRSSWRMFRCWQVFTSNRASRRGFLRALSIVMKLSKSSPELSPSNFFRLYAKEETWVVRNRIQVFAARLEAGDSIANALEQVPDLVSDADLLAIRLASQSGTLPQTIQSLADQQCSIAEPVESNQGTWPYFIALTLAFCVVVSFLRALVVPTFRVMFDEFGLSLPPAFEMAFNPWTDMLLMAIPVALIGGLLTLWVATKYGLMRSFRRKLGSFLSRQQHRSGIAQTLKLMSEAMQMGRPIAGSLSTLARYHHDARIRTQLLVARNDMELGTDFAESLNQAGLLTGEQAMALTQLETNCDQGWLMDQMADQMLSSIAYRRRVTAVVMQPLIVLLFGVPTIAICLGISLVLIKMITSLT
jgi:type II secretory pathway component PulF